MLTEAEIKRIIEDDVMSEKKRLAAIGQRYYEAEHDILNYRVFYYNTDGILVKIRPDPTAVSIIHSLRNWWISWNHSRF